MKRNIDELKATRFDLLVIGGGIYGAATAWEAARRGLSVGLIEQDDFGGATSANSLKVIHGGIRYLQHGDIPRLRRSVRARRKLLSMMPHWVAPMAFIIPTVSRSVQCRAFMELALFANNIFAWDRNKGVPAANRIPRGHGISKRKCLELIPNLPLRDLDGGAVWYDGFAHNIERLNLEFILTASAHGAFVANYVKAIEWVKKGRRISGVILRNRLTNQEFEAGARVVVDARGPWIDQEMGGPPEAFNGSHRWAKAVNLILRKPLFGDFAVGLPGHGGYRDKEAIVNRGNRFFFCVPWRGGTIIGTHYQHYSGNPDDCRLTRTDAEALIKEINNAYPPANLSLSDIAFYHTGLVPVARNAFSQRQVILEKHTTLYDHEKLLGINGLISIKGVKYTTAIETAGMVVDLVLRKLGRRKAHYNRQPLSPSVSENVSHFKVPATDKAPTNNVEKEAHLKSIYGRQAHLIMQLIRNNEALDERLDSFLPCTKAEVIHSVRNEMACTLNDVLMRRTSLATFGNPGNAIIEQVADLLATELRWSKIEKTKQIDSAYAAFQMPF